MNLITLTTSNVESLNGKKIRWYAPASKWNENYTGIALITSVDVSERRPIKSETLDGDTLDYAFVDDLMNDGSISYSDSYRNVTFKIVE